jgi:hypothetical protein
MAQSKELLVEGLEETIEAAPDTEPEIADPGEFFAKNAFRIVYQTNNFFLPQIRDLIEILDVSLDDGVCTPVLDELSRRFVPVLIYTGGITPDLQQRQEAFTLLRKPAPAKTLQGVIRDLLTASETGRRN